MLNWPASKVRMLKEQMLAYLLVGIRSMLSKMHDWTLLDKWRGILHPKDGCLSDRLLGWAPGRLPGRGDL